MTNHAPDIWPTQLIVLHGEDREELLGRLVWLQQWADDNPQGDLASLGQWLFESVHPGGERLAMLAADIDELRQRTERSLQRLSDPHCDQIRDVGGIYYSQQPLYRDGAKIAMLFPGEGAQYLGMLGDMMALPEVRSCFELASQTIIEAGSGASPPLEFTEVPADEQQRSERESRLKRLDNAMLTVLSADWALSRVLEQMGVPCGAMAGHSAGELAALMMSDALEASEGLSKLITSITELEASPGVDATLLAIGASRDAVESLLQSLPSDGELRAELAMDNCPHQTVVVGLSTMMGSVEQAVQQRGWMYERLTLARPYHTALFEPLMDPLRKMFAEVEFGPPKIPVYSCTTGAMFPRDAAEMRDLCVSHWRCRVEFVKMIRQMYDDGVRIFVEAGPRGNLCSFVDDILRGEPHLAAPANLPRRHGLIQLQHLAAQLYSHGVPLRLEFFTRSATTDAAEDHLAGTDAVHAPLRETIYPSTPRGRVMAEYLQVMDDFLATQQHVMTRYLSNGNRLPVSPAARPALPAPAPSDGGGQDAPDEQPAFDDLFAPNEEVDPLTRPLIGEILESQPGKTLVMQRVLDVEEDVYADHHTVGGRSISRVDPSQHGLPIVPLTFTVEMMAEFAQALLPERTVRQIKNVQLMRWLAMEHGDPGKVEVTARSLGESDEDRQRDESRVLVQIRILGSANKPEPKRPVAAVGTVVLGSTRLEPDCEYRPMDLPGSRPCDVTLDVMYNNLFHGELFRGVDSLDVIADAGMEGSIHALPREQVFRSIDDPQFIADPILLDVGMHPPVAWHLEEPDQEGRILLPFELERLDFFGRRPAPHHPFVSQTRVVETTARHFAHVTELFDGVTGKIWARIYKVKLWRFYFPFRDVNFHGPKDVYFFSTKWDHALPEEVAEVASLARMEPLEDLRSPALLSAAARVLMSPSEFDRFENLQRPPEKKPQYLFGRIAAKDAVRFHRRKTHDQRLFMADVEIDVNDQGQPLAIARGETEDIGFPSISISHCDKLVCALAANHPWVGVDLEPIVPRESSFERIAFSTSERALLDKFSDPQSRPEQVTRFWCAKEAVAKALGEGLVEGVHALHVASVDSDRQLTVVLGRELAARFPQFAEQPLVVWTYVEDGYVVAASLCWKTSDVASDGTTRVSGVSKR